MQQIHAAATESQPLLASEKVSQSANLNPESQRVVGSAKIFTTEEYKQASEMPPSFFKYAYVERELIEYMKELLGLFTLEFDSELNVLNKNFLIEKIQAKLKDHGVKIMDRDFVGIVLDLIRIVNDIVWEENANAMDEREKDLFLYIIASSFLKVGIEAYTFEEHSLSGMAAQGLKIDEESRSVRIL